MNANQIAQIATSLNVSPNQIKRAEEWASVLFVVVTGLGARFVSKKVIKMVKQIKGVKTMNINQFNQQILEFFQKGFNSVKESYGYTSEFIAVDSRNNNDFYRSIKLIIEDEFQSQLWKVSEGCFNGHGETLAEAIASLSCVTQNISDPSSTKAFLLPMYD